MKREFPEAVEADGKIETPKTIAGFRFPASHVLAHCAR